MEVPAWLAAAATAVATAISAYLIKRRSEAGTVQTTDAKTLWQEASAYRQVLVDQIAARDKRIAELEAELDRRDRDENA